MKRVLITGGAGFIGNAIIDEIQNKYDIRVLDNLSPQIHGEKVEESFLYNSIKDRVEFIKGDVRVYSDMQKALKDVDYIIHLAAETGTGQSMYEINQYSDVNLMGTSNMLQVILQEKIKIEKLVLASSRSVYGEGSYECKKHGIVVPKSRDIDAMKAGEFDCTCPKCNSNVELVATREDSPLNSISYYALTKEMQENMLKLMCPVIGIEYTIFRYQNVYGAGQSLNNPYTGILSIFSKQFLSNNKVNIFEDGLESRDFVHVKDVARVTCLSLENNESNGETINVGSGDQVNVLKVAETLKEFYKSSSDIIVTGDFRQGDIRHNIADISKIKSIFNYEFLYTFKTGMKQFSDWVIEEIAKKPTNIDNSAFDRSINELKESGMMFTKDSK